MWVYIWNKLPSEYQEVEYIQSSWTQWIDTLIKATNNTKVEIKTSNTYTSGSQLAIMGSRTFPKTNAFMISFYSNGWICWDWAESQMSNILNKTSILLIDKNLSYIYNENTSTYDLMHTFTNATFTTPSNMIFFWERQGNTVMNLSTIKFYYCKIWENNTLVRDFITCYRKSDSVIWMYDLVNNQFYTNSWSGTFSKWSDVNTYRESSLKNAYIGEVWTPTSNTLAYYKFEWNLNDSSGNWHNLTNSWTISYNTSPIAVNLSTSNYLYFNNSDTFNHDRTYNTWAYITARNNQNNSTVFLCQWTQGTNNMVYCALDYQWKLHFWFYGEDYYWTTTSSLNQWVNVCYTYEYSTKTYKAYINWVNNLNGTKTSQYSVASWNLYMWALANNTWNTNYRIQWKIWTSVLEKTLWNADKVLNYYNTFKANYWL